MKKVLKEYFLDNEEASNGASLKEFLLRELDSIYFEPDTDDVDDDDMSLSTYCKEKHQDVINVVNNIPDDVTFKVDLDSDDCVETQLNMPTLWIESSDAFNMFGAGDTSGIDEVLDELKTWITVTLPTYYNNPQDTEKAGRIEEDVEKLAYNQTHQINKSTGKDTIVTWEATDQSHSGWIAEGVGEDGSNWSGMVFPTERRNSPDWGTLDIVEQELINSSDDETGFRTYQNIEKPEEIDTEIKLNTGKGLEEGVDLVKAKIINTFYKNWSLDDFLNSLKSVAIEVKSQLKNDFLILKDKIVEALNKINWESVNKNAIYNIIQTDLRGNIDVAKKVVERLNYYTTKGLHEDIVNMNKSKSFNEDITSEEHKQLEPGDRVTLLNTPQIKEEMKRKWGTNQYAGKEGEVVRISGLPNCVVIDIDDSGMTVDTPVDWIQNNVEIES